MKWCINVLSVMVLLMYCFVMIICVFVLSVVLIGNVLRYVLVLIILLGKGWLFCNLCIFLLCRVGNSDMMLLFFIIVMYMFMFSLLVNVCSVVVYLCGFMLFVLVMMWMFCVSVFLSIVCIVMFIKLVV